MRRAGKPKSQKQKKKSDSPSISRLKEMLGVLRQHDIVHGVNPEKLRLILEDMGPHLCEAGTNYVHAVGYPAPGLLRRVDALARGCEAYALFPGTAGD